MLSRERQRLLSLSLKHMAALQHKEQNNGELVLDLTLLSLSLQGINTHSIPGTTPYRKQFLPTKKPYQ